MAESNTYKGSIRDGVKYLTLNGVRGLPLSETDWGWYGAATYRTAHYILSSEYGPKTAKKYFARFAREHLAVYPEEGFTLTSGMIAFIINQMEKPE